MDLDAEMKKVKTFMDNMHALFPGGADGLKAAATAARNGDSPAMSSAAMPDSSEFAGVMDDVREVLAMGERIKQLLPEIEQAIGTVKDLAGQVESIAEAVTALQQAQGTPAAVGGASSGQTGDEGATGNQGGQ